MAAQLGPYLCDLHRSRLAADPDRPWREDDVQADLAGQRSLVRSAGRSLTAFTEEALVHALARHPDVDVVYNANPNGTVTDAAYSHAGHAGVEVLGFRDLMGRLHEA